MLQQSKADRPPETDEAANSVNLTQPSATPPNGGMIEENGTEINGELPSSRWDWHAWLLRRIPALDALRNYSIHAAWADLVAGLSVAALAVPQAMAYAMIVGLPPQYGLYTAIVMTAVGAVLDSSRQLINGPTSAISIALLSALAPLNSGADGEPGILIRGAVLMALLVGAIQLLMTLLRLGDLTRFISPSVILGFTLGANAVLFLEQLKNLFGLRSVGSGHEHFLVRWWRTLWEGGPVHVPTLAVGLSTILIILFLIWLNRRFRLHRFRIPEFLTAVLLAGTISYLLGLEEHGVRTIGEIPRQLPQPTLPPWDWKLVTQLAPSALAIAILGLLEALAMAKAIAAYTRQRLDLNQQCLSEALANFAGSFFQCMPGSGSLSRSAINHMAGAVSQWSGVIAAAAVALTVLLFAPYARYVPRAALSGILIVTAVRMINPRDLAYYVRASRFDAAIIAITSLSAVAISIEFCILIGTFCSFVFYVPRAARMHLTRLTVTPERVVREAQAGDPPCWRMLLFSLEGDLFFGAAPDLEKHLDAIRAQCTSLTRIIVLRLKRVRNPDAACLRLLDEFVADMQARGICVYFCGVRRDLAEAFERCGLVHRLGKEYLFLESGATWSSTLDAVRHAYAQLGADLCPHCPRRQAPSEPEAWYYII
ncbi:MAG: SulP family inorganic anion transporter [Gemmatales bacterium]|nr:SulP family inorganic anion transporter [Gemmatales bacterium]MDW7995456.1 SulP family inorganic anion transporter [Gemmatales bacterium]